MKDKIESQHILVIYFRVIFYLVLVLTCKILLLSATNHNFTELQILFQIKAPLIFDNIIIYYLSTCVSLHRCKKLEVKFF